ncbi:MAG: hypothetical protein J2O49_05650, partial [Sciscionella sp.]|nr:hypothetical protein [Sciscionella sp.]
MGWLFAHYWGWSLLAFVLGLLLGWLIWGVLLRRRGVGAHREHTVRADATTAAKASAASAPASTTAASATAPASATAASTTAAPAAKHAVESDATALDTAALDTAALDTAALDTDEHGTTGHDADEHGKGTHVGGKIAGAVGGLAAGGAAAGLLHRHHDKHDESEHDVLPDDGKTVEPVDDKLGDATVKADAPEGKAASEINTDPDINADVNAGDEMPDAERTMVLSPIRDAEPKTGPIALPAEQHATVDHVEADSTGDDMAGVPDDATGKAGVAKGALAGLAGGAAAGGIASALTGGHQRGHDRERATADSKTGDDVDSLAA